MEVDSDKAKNKTSAAHIIPTLAKPKSTYAWNAREDRATKKVDICPQEVSCSKDERNSGAVGRAMFSEKITTAIEHIV